MRRDSIIEDSHFDDYNLGYMTIKNEVRIDNRDRTIYKDVFVMNDGFHMSIDALPAFISLGKRTQLMLMFILKTLKYGSNVIHINRKEAIKFLSDDKHTSNKYEISTALSELTDKGFIEKLDTNYYEVIVSTLYKGNLDKMRKEIELQRERLAKGNVEDDIESYTEIDKKRTLRINLNKENED